MPLWADALIFVAVVGGIGWVADFLARRRRRGLEEYGNPADTGDPIANAERAMPGAATRAHPPHPPSGPSGL